MSEQEREFYICSHKPECDLWMQCDQMSDANAYGYECECGAVVERYLPAASKREAADDLYEALKGEGTDPSIISMLHMLEQFGESALGTKSGFCEIIARRRTEITAALKRAEGKDHE